MEDLEPTEGNSLILKYENYPIVRSLIQLVPFGIGSAIDVALMGKINNMKTERTRVFFDKILENNIALKEEQLEDKEFLHAYFATTKAYLNTQRHEKIQLFAQLFSRYCEKGIFEAIDDYEESLSILDELSYREFEILLILNEFENKNPIKEGQNYLQRALVYWENFINQIEQDIGLLREEIPGVLERINRTGLYQTFTGGFMDYTGDVGKLTPNFQRFLKELDLV
ncbi:MAG: hypothetical protein OEZ51_12240 [Nitrospinota bacterium]|nr:hypothetical protein [Nitrospinota bacterium]